MTYKYVNNIYFRCLLLLLVAGACASQRTGRHYYQQTDGAGTTAAVQDTEYGERRMFAVVMGCGTKGDRFRSLKYMYETAMAAYK